MQLAQEDAQAQQILGQVAPEMVADYAQDQLDKALEKAKNESDPQKRDALLAEAYDNWGEEGAARIALHTLTGALSGNAESALGNLATAIAIPEIHKALANSDLSETEQSLLLLAASAGIGSAANGGQGALAAAGQTSNNYLNHQETETRDQLRETLEQCQDSANSCTSSEIAELENLVQQLDQQDKELDRAIMAACGFGNAGSDACSRQSTFAVQAMLSWEQEFAEQEGISKQDKQAIYQEWVDAGRPKDSGAGEYFTNLYAIAKAASFNQYLRNPDNAQTIDVLDRLSVLDFVGGSVSMLGGSEEVADLAGLVTGGAALVGGAGKVFLKKLTRTDTPPDIPDTVVLRNENGNLVPVKGPEGNVPNPNAPRDEFTGPQNSTIARADLEATHGADNIKSTTVVQNPRQTVNSNPQKNIEVIRDSYGNKAVRVEYKDPVTNESKVANIAYDSQRGLPVFDDHAKYTTNIKKPSGYENMSSDARKSAEMRAATRDLREKINSGVVDKSDFTPAQLRAINSGKENIPGYTWHHNDQSAPNNMQLLPKDVHDAAKHIGEASLSEGR